MIGIHYNSLYWGLVCFPVSLCVYFKTFMVCSIKKRDFEGACYDWLSVKHKTKDEYTWEEEHIIESRKWSVVSSASSEFNQ